MWLRIFVGMIGIVSMAMIDSSTSAHQAGGVEVGDLETGSVVGQSFKEVDVDAVFYAVTLDL